MADLTTTYMGLNIKNPIIVSSSSLTNNVNGIKSCENSGAAAVVLKSLFEEQITSEIEAIEKEEYLSVHPEAADYIRQLGMDMRADQYLELIEQAKNEVKIPIIASLNCISESCWIEFAKNIESAGADAIELNIALMPKEFFIEPTEIEDQVIGIVSAVRKMVNIPVAVKIGPYFTSIPKMAERLQLVGANALVMFNRFYRPDVDIEKIEMVPGYRYSTPEEIALSLRWIGILSRQMKMDLAGSTGIFDGAGVIKHLLAGAKTTMICSTLFINGFKQINIMLDRIQFWMDTHNYNSINDFRGILSHKSTQKPAYFERLQYIKALVGIE
jgi:dihydroorotate dehydrogenase (fumarate)